MSLAAGCPRCPTPLVQLGAGPGGWSCPAHGPIRPLWRPAEASYDAFAEHLGLASGFPTYLPWPLSPGWSVTDFGTVGGVSWRPTATMSCCSGPTDIDGPVDLLVVTEELGTGLGARCAGRPHDEPGDEVGAGPPAVRVQVDGKHVPLWLVTSGTPEADRDLDRSVLAGEAGGRWLWIVLRPAAAVLLLADEWAFRDVSGLGPTLVEMPFGGPAPSW